MSWLPNKAGRRRVIWLALVCVGLVAIESALHFVFGVAVGYSFDTHPLGVMYAKFIRVINTAFAGLVLIASVRALRRFLPQLYRWMAGLLLLTIWTALVMAVAGRDSGWAFRASMWHMAAGQLATPLVCAYVFHHVLIYFPAATPDERRSGLRLAAFTIIVLLLGAFFSVIGGPELLPFLRVHGVGAILIPPLVAWHVRERRRRKKSDPTALGTATLFGGRGWAVAGVISAVVPLLFYGLSEDWLPKPVPRFSRFFEPLPKDHYAPATLPADYDRPFGEAPFLPARIETPGDLAIPARFLNTANSCSYEGCHTDLGKHWAVSGHRHARNVFVEKVMEELRIERGVAATRACAGCHDPVNLVSGAIRRSGEPILDAENEGVTCLICHAVPTADPRPSNGSLSLAATPVFFDRLVERNQYLMTVLFLGGHKKELYHLATLRDPALCGACHVQELVHDGGGAPIVVQDKLSDWRIGLYSSPDGPAGLRACVDCHMPPVMESYQGRAVRSHRFLSSNTGIPAFYAGDERYESYARRYLGGIQQAAFTHAENVALSQQHLQSAVKLAIDPVGEPVLRPTGERSVELRVIVTNDRVGHKFPAGASDLIDVWLQTEVVDAGGEVVWSDGVPGPDGRLPEGTARFGSEWYDASGRRLMHHEIWKLAEVRNDRRIASGSVGEHVLSFDVSPTARWPISVRVRLRHRRFNPEFAEWAVGDEAARLPVTDVQERTIQVDPLSDAEDPAVSISRPGARGD